MTGNMKEDKLLVAMRIRIVAVVMVLSSSLIVGNMYMSHKLCDWLEG